MGHGRPCSSKTSKILPRYTTVAVSDREDRTQNERREFQLTPWATASWLRRTVSTDVGCRAWQCVCAYVRICVLQRTCYGTVPCSRRRACVKGTILAHGAGGTCSCAAQTYAHFCRFIKKYENYSISKVRKRARDLADVSLGCSAV
jgi:hypothetical protein